MQYEKNPFYTLPVLLQLPRRCESGVKVSLCFCRGVVPFIIRREGALFGCPWCLSSAVLGK